jgi:hypothetical protein
MSGSHCHLGNGQGDYQGNATMKQFSKFAQWLPDMDLVFNVLVVDTSRMGSVEILLSEK